MGEILPYFKPIQKDNFVCKGFNHIGSALVAKRPYAEFSVAIGSPSRLMTQGSFQLCTSVIALWSRENIDGTSVNKPGASCFVVK